MNFDLDFDFDTNKVLMIIATYGMVQVLAQDLGIKTGKKQRDLMQSMPIQMVLLFSGAYSMVNNYRDAAIVTIIYYFLKYIYSNGETSAVCFEDV